MTTWADEWLESQSNPRTQRAYGHALAAFAGFVNGQLAGATPGAALDWQLHLAASGKSPATIRSMAAAMWSFYQAGIEKGLHSGVNPFDPAIVSRPRREPAAAGAPRASDLRAAARTILDSINTKTVSGARASALFQVWIATDYPLAELVRLRLQHLKADVRAGMIPPNVYMSVLRYFALAGRGADLTPDRYLFLRFERPQGFRPAAPDGHLSPSQASDILTRLVRHAGFDPKIYTLRALKQR